MSDEILSFSPEKMNFRLDIGENGDPSSLVIKKRNKVLATIDFDGVLEINKSGFKPDFYIYAGLIAEKLKYNLSVFLDQINQIVLSHRRSINEDTERFLADSDNEYDYMVDLVHRGLFYSGTLCADCVKNGRVVYVKVLGISEEVRRKPPVNLLTRWETLMDAFDRADRDRDAQFRVCHKRLMESVKRAHLLAVEGTMDALRALPRHLPGVQTSMEEY